MKRAAQLSCVLSFVIVIAAIGLSIADRDPASVIGALFFAVFPVVALLITRERPRNAVAWCFIVASLLNGIEKIGQKIATLGLRHGWPTGVTHVAAWVQAWPWFPGLFLLVTVALLRFPESRLVSPGWRWVERASFATFGVWTLSLGTAAWLIPTRVLLAAAEPDPVGVAGVLFRISTAMFPVIFVCVLASLTSLVIRYRRSDAVGREQTRWVLSAASVAILLEVGVDVYGTYVGSTPDVVQTLGEGVGFGLIATATGIAITRYKLYEIERIVSRTVTYVSVLLVLAAVYVGVLVTLAALVPADLGQVGVAAATLVVSVVAVPLTRRVRRLVDRRFNRSRFDADGVVAAFAARLRARPERGDIPADLVDVLGRTVQPAHAAVWLVPRSTP